MRAVISILIKSLLISNSWLSEGARCCVFIVFTLIKLNLADRRIHSVSLVTNDALSDR